MELTLLWLAIIQESLVSSPKMNGHKITLRARLIKYVLIPFTAFWNGVCPKNP